MNTENQASKAAAAAATGGKYIVERLAVCRRTNRPTDWLYSCRVKKERKKDEEI